MKIQCLLPKYNNGQYFSSAIESLLKQTSPFSSIIISENHSNDGSIKLVEQYANNYSNIKYFIPNTFAPTFGHNVAELLKKIDITADFILIASSDDIWQPTFNEKMIYFIKNNDNQ